MCFANIEYPHCYLLLVISKANHWKYNCSCTDVTQSNSTLNSPGKTVINFNKFCAVNEISNWQCQFLTAFVYISQCIYFRITVWLKFASLLSPEKFHQCRNVGKKQASARRTLWDSFLEERKFCNFEALCYEEIMLIFIMIFGDQSVRDISVKITVCVEVKEYSNAVR